jgi:hypothetical protein
MLRKILDEENSDFCEIQEKNKNYLILSFRKSLKIFYNKIIL